MLATVQSAWNLVLANLYYVSNKVCTTQVSDFGPRTSLRIVDGIRDSIKAGRTKTKEDIRAVLKQSISAALQPPGAGSELRLETEGPCVILVVGVNGGGKTTTIGKLAHRLAQQNVQVSLFERILNIQQAKSLSSQQQRMQGFMFTLGQRARKALASLN